MKKPIIGIMPSHDGEYMRLKSTYHEAIWAAGGVPLTLAYTTDEKRLAEYIEICDGFLFSGGLDLAPALYGEETTHEMVEIDKARDDFEGAIFPIVIETKKPILGICRGIQAINVFLGGSLYQHVDGHRQTEAGTQPKQRVKVESGSLLHKITGKNELFVNTFHHQAIKRLAEPLAIDAISDDGIIEAVHYKRDEFFLAVQWHPEIYFANDEPMKRLFEAFVNECK